MCNKLSVPETKCNTKSVTHEESVTLNSEISVQEKCTGIVRSTTHTYNGPSICVMFVIHRFLGENVTGEDQNCSAVGMS